MVESERDALKAQLNNEIVLKEKCMEQAESADRNLREAKRSIEELGAELRMSQTKIGEVEAHLEQIKKERQVSEE